VNIISLYLNNPWHALPVTFHIDNGLSDIEYIKFLDYYQRVEIAIQNKQMYKRMELERRRQEAK
jgi:hypothetical protein